MFQRLGEREKYEPPLKENSLCFSFTIDIKELLERQEEIDRAILFRLRRQENTYVHIAEAEPQDIFLSYYDEYPFFNLRMKVWGWYL